MDTEKRFLNKVNKTETCWLWIGCVLKNGYGQFSVNGKKCYAHRYSYELYIGKIPDGLVIDHLCRVRNCTNPEHLEPVTQRQNIRRGNQLIAERVPNGICKHGHHLVEGNYYLYRGSLACKQCSINGYRRWYLAHKKKKLISTL